jgi:hypothetical protein
MDRAKQKKTAENKNGEKIDGRLKSGINPGRWAERLMKSLHLIFVDKLVEFIGPCW